MNAIRKLAFGSAMAVLLSSVTALAQPSDRSQEQPITPEQAFSNQGQHVTVEGIASLSDANGLPAGLFLRLSTTGPGAAFAGYISAENQGKFPGLGTLQGKLISITGVVETTSTIPIIRLTSPEQIRIVR
jgi:hypothetical protein